MAENYCVFWLPRLYHQDIAVLNATNSLSEDISDGICEAVHRISVEIGNFEEGERDIAVRSMSGNHHETVVLKYISSSRNGLIQYFYKADSRYRETRFIVDAISGPVYHLIKGFFHKHEYHDINGDYTLTAFLSNKKIDLEAIDNEALVFYLEQYESKFRGYRELAFDKLDFIIQKNQEDLNESFYNYTTRQVDLDLFCDNALGESLYYESLLHSWYNESCRYNHTDRKHESLQHRRHKTVNPEKEDMQPCEHCKRLHRSALNTKNAIDSIRQIRKKNKHLHNFKEGEYLFDTLDELQKQQNTIQILIRSGDEIAKTSKMLAWVSVSLGVMSLTLGIWSVVQAFLRP
ncbi:MAG: hypothetical protein LBL04_16480 [Bacteroidales bacterium]|jgi:hypothetical protein|nr:hypothetical protein [Bacteroidales bacterium]